MQIVKGTVHWQQRIQYAHGDEDSYSRQCEGEWYQLKQYQKIKYKHSHNDFIELKWYNVTGKSRVELRQASGNLVFDLDKMTINSYQTQEGIMELTIVTHSIEIHSTNDRVEMSIRYQMIVNQIALGDYDFQLHFTI